MLAEAVWCGGRELTRDKDTQLAVGPAGWPQESHSGSLGFSFLTCVKCRFGILTLIFYLLLSARLEPSFGLLS